LAALPLVVVIVMNFFMSLVVFPRFDFSFLSEPQWGSITIGAVSGLWSVIVALGAANLTVILVNFRRLPSLRESLDAGVNSAALPMLMIASLVGFGAVVAALPAFALVRDAVFSIQGGPLVSLAVSMNVLAGLTGTASGGMAIVLNAFGNDFLRLATEHHIDLDLMHRITTMSAGTLDALPHNGTVLLLLQISGLTHGESYLDMVMTVIVSCIIALVAVLVLGTLFGSF
jgi:H+/gluconate symporter-like permease